MAPREAAGGKAPGSGSENPAGQHDGSDQRRRGGSQRGGSQQGGGGSGQRGRSGNGQREQATQTSKALASSSAPPQRSKREGGGSAAATQAKQATAAPSAASKPAPPANPALAPPPPGDVSLDGAAFSIEEGEAWTGTLSEAGKAAPGKGARAEGAGPGARRALPTAAWLKAAASGPVRAATTATAASGGWNAVELALEEGDGTVTIKARREREGSVAVSVGFSEPRLRAQATANARQLQDALQSQYETDVDLTFAGGQGGNTDQEAPRDGAPREAASLGALPGEPAANEAPASRPRAGARREWIG